MIILLLLAIMVLLVYFPAYHSSVPIQRHAWEKIRTAQRSLYQWKMENISSFDPKADPWELGFIGQEWSPLTTTLGSLPSKRTSCHPMWSFVAEKWFQRLGLGEGDRIAIFSSSSFPGMLFNVLAACERYGLEVLLIVSIGSSTWGANSPEAMWVHMEGFLVSSGFLNTRADYYTLGGEGETGGGFPEEGLAIINRVIEEKGIPMIIEADLEGMIRRKRDILAEFQPRVMVNIGGSEANLGESQEVLDITPGIILPGGSQIPRHGLIGEALRMGIPVIHILDLRGLAAMEGVPYDAAPQSGYLPLSTIISDIIGIACFFTFLSFHERWRISRNIRG